MISLDLSKLFTFVYPIYLRKENIFSISEAKDTYHYLIKIANPSIKYFLNSFFDELYKIESLKYFHITEWKKQDSWL